MRLRLVLLVTMVATGYAQLQSEPAAYSRESRLLTEAEGMALVQSAWNHRRSIRKKPDCSNLVHQIYKSAGLNYEFASSRDLMEGWEPFVRVQEPQPGDLIVWRGHVGIVVDPEQHTFYSSLRSGLRTDFYDAAHWRRRGTHRFYRYTTSGEPTLLASSTANNASTDLNALRPLSRVAARRASSSAGQLSVVTLEARKPTKAELYDALLARGDLLAEEQETSEDPSGTIIVFKSLRTDKVAFKDETGSAQIRVEPLLTIKLANAVRDSKGKSYKLQFQRVGEGWSSASRLPYLLSPEQGIRVLTNRMAEISADRAKRGELRQYQAALKVLLDVE